MKRLFDLTISLIGLIVLFPVFFILLVLVKIFPGGPVFFLQPRIGKYGKVFTMIKFRSMKVIQSFDTTISVKGDLRITKFGFRKAYCKLHIQYNLFFKFLVMIMYPLRFVFYKFNNKFAVKITSLLLQEEIRRSFL